MDTYEVGDLGEKIACEYLVKKGYKILGKNYRITSEKNKVFGEIDIIARKRLAPLNKIFQILNFASGQNLFNRVKNIFKLLSNDKTIHFVEVKTIMEGKSSFYPEEKVDYKKRNKLKKLCLIWLKENDLPEYSPYQIDVIGILINPMIHRPKISYFENVVDDN